MRAARAVVRTSAAGLALCALAACGGSSEDRPAAPAATGTPTGTVTVLAAASLRTTFTQLARAFERDHPGTTVRLSFGPSSGLAQQVVQGAPADVLASASAATMATVTRAGAAADPVTFAVNRMQVAVPPSNPAGITGLADLVRPGVTVALCQPQVPCGAVARTVLRQAALDVTPVTEEVDVGSVLTKVQLGEVDAGVVYVTDVRTAGARVRGVVIPDDVNASTSYPIATLAAAPNPVTARAFVAAVLAPAGQRVLAAAGFASP